MRVFDLGIIVVALIALTILIICTCQPRAVGRADRDR